MPNWATTYYEFHGEPERIKEFKEYMDKLSTDSKIENDFGDTWLGHIAYNILKEDGYTDDDAKEHTLDQSEFRARGWFEDPLDFLNDDVLTCQISSAWCEPENLFERILKVGNFEDIKMYWQCFEYATNYYATNDIDKIVFNETYHIDIPFDLQETLDIYDELYTDDDIKNVLNNLYATNYREQTVDDTRVENIGLDTLIEIINNSTFTVKHIDYHITIIPFTIVE